METIEIWKDIIGYEGLYQVSNLGKIRSFDRPIRTGKGNATRRIHGRIHKQTIDAWGYSCVSLNKQGVGKKSKVHRIVAIAFIPNPENKRGVNHIDGDKQNNQVTNLEWATIKENNDHAIESGIHSAKLNLRTARIIRASYVTTRTKNEAHKTLAKRFNVSVTSIRSVLENITFKE